MQSTVTKAPPRSPNGCSGLELKIDARFVGGGGRRGSGGPGAQDESTEPSAIAVTARTAAGNAAPGKLKAAAGRHSI